MPTQIQMYYAAERRTAELNLAFIELVQHRTNPLTRADLAALIRKRPHVYSRFAGWLDKLPH